MTSLSQLLSWPVEMRLSHDSSEVSIAGTSFCSARPVCAEMFTRSAHGICTSSRSISFSSW